MARSGVYKTEVRKARDSLLAQGKHPSIDAVRVALGNTGSKTTIHRYLKELDAEEGAGVGTKVAISEALQDLVGRLAGRLHEEAEALITEAKQRADALLKERNAVIERQQQELVSLGAQLERTELTLQTEKAAHADVQQQLQDDRIAVAQLEERLAGLTAQLAERDTHVQSLETKHQHAREALEHYRNSIKEQRDQEQRRHEHQVQEVQVALRQANAALGKKNQELLDLNRDNARLTTQVAQLDKTCHQLQHEQQRLQHETKTLQVTARDHEKLKARLEQAMRESERRRAMLAEAQTNREKERNLRRTAETERNQFQGRVQALESIVTAWQLSEAEKKPPTKTNT